MDHDCEERSSEMEANNESLQETMCHWWTFLKKDKAAGEEPKHEEGEPFIEEENVRNPLSSYFKVEAKIDILPFDGAMDA